MKRLLIALTAATCASVSAQVPAARPGAFALTVDSIMRGPELVGYPPENPRWSGDSQRLYFEWRQPTDDVAATWVTDREGGALRYRGYDIEEPDRLAPPRPAARLIAGVPLPVVLKAARSVRSLVWHRLRGNQRDAFRHELWLCSFAGVVRQRWHDRHLPVAHGPAEDGAPARNTTARVNIAM